MSTTANFETLAEKIQAQGFDHPFVLFDDEGWDADASVYAPSVYNSDTNDIDIDDDGWEALTGLTGQYSYRGAVMHPSEFIGSQIAAEMARLSEDEPQTFVVTEVRDLDDEEALIGWAILRKV